MCTLHSSVIDFKFSGILSTNPNLSAGSAARRMIHSNSDDEDVGELDANHTFLENGILVEKKIYT